MALYLADADTAQTAFELAALDENGLVVLLQDGVTRAGSAPRSVPCYAVAADVTRRGLAAFVGEHVQLVDYGELVDLIFQHPVVNLG